MKREDIKNNQNDEVNIENNVHCRSDILFHTNNQLKTNEDATIANQYTNIYHNNKLDSFKV